MHKIKDYIYYNRKEIITIIICLTLFGGYILFKKDDSYIIEENIVKEEIKDNKIIIDIKGEVNKPGTYEMNENDRIMDAIEISGGLTNKADTSSINLSEKLKDEMLILIPSIEEINEIVEENKKSNNIKTSEVKDSKISINTASISELMKINGIGQAKAQAIIDYRSTNGLFKDIKDITKVSGIGNSTFEKIKDYIKI